MSLTTSNVGSKTPFSSSNGTSSPPIAVSSPNFESRRSSLLSAPALSAAPRKGQGGRKQHKEKRRPLRESRGGEDDNMAEMVSRPRGPRPVPEGATNLKPQRALRNPSSRRGQTSITHLLNYSAPSRQYAQHEYGHGRSSRRQATWGRGSGYHPIDKAKFVHANYRFVVSALGSYTAQAADADQHLDWSDVQQIIASAESQATSCPICLSEPVAPRMAKCGHIFCLPCLIRFMNSTSEDAPSARKEGRWKRCPICEDSFKLAETRPVRFYAGQENPLPRPGDDVVLRLMVRRANSTLALPNEGGVDVFNLGEDVPWHFAANILDYARIMKGTNDYLMAQYDGEVEELRRQATEDELYFGQEDGGWTQKAIRAVTTAKDNLRDVQVKAEDEHPALTSSRMSKAQDKEPAGHAFYFYTAPPHLYLSPLDIRILKSKFGDFSNFPSTLLPRVEHISTGHTVDEAMRKRAKYLGHLPLGCVVNFLECDWTDIVPAEVLDKFSSELERRRKSHHDKALQEERERVQAERLEATAIGRGARRHFDLTHEDSFESTPAISADDFLPLGSAPDMTSPSQRPGFETLADMSTSPSNSRTVWGTRAIDASPEPGSIPVDDAHTDGWLKEDDFLSAAEVALAMEAFAMDDVGSSSNANAGPSTGATTTGGTGKKKKKKQKITLMSTGGRRMG